MRAMPLVIVLVACGAPPAPPAAPMNSVTPSTRPTDSDHDGIADDRDRCPHAPEDYDLFADDDGCPDPDNDGDGIADADDDCPYEAGPAHGCVTPCRVIITDTDDCFLDPTVFYDAHDVPQRARLDEIERLVRANPSVEGVEVLGLRSELVAAPLRARLPDLEIVEQHRDIGIARAVYVRIAKQRFDAGRFRTSECTAFGPIYHPARAQNCVR